ncbi:alpha/beta hydrolase [Streptomyces prasinopilosus]|uniref:TAP-like protein n=1 Tax=Streptomyces prasinopilosus TaxID=67344 RepID=A0A1G6TME7_9ACTN|nr:alpha/beta hydrolase [Streptomyces prasinopilosus]SDD30263.1 TAP-like protein [Streptomyces prasinopilosus]
MSHHRSSRAAIGLVSLAVLAAATLTACDPEAEDDGAAAIPAVPAALSEQKLDWAACPAPSAAQGGGEKPEDLPDGTKWQCATMKAPLDYAKPDGRTIDIALVRAKTAEDSGEGRIGSLVFNFGGPGGAGVPTLPALAGEEYLELHKRYDLVSFDPRGVGNSAGVQCLDDKAMDAWLAQDSTPDDAAEEKALTVGGSLYARACKSRSGGVLEHVGTQEAARDLDLMRHVLGDDKLNYFGISYGTQLGGVYAHLFPKNVGRTVFDAVVDPTEGFAANLLDQTEGFESALQNFLKDCVKQDECFFEGKDPARGEKEITELLESLDTKPLPVEDDDRVLTQGQAGMGILTALYSQDIWSWLNRALQAAEKGEGGGLLWLSDMYAERNDGVYSNSGPANTAVNCADSKDRFTVEDVHQQLPEFRKASSVFGDMLAWMLLACTDWPVGGHASTVDVKADGAGPVLVIGNTGDPATPYEGAEKMADALGEGVGVHLTVEGEGHGTYGVNKCLTKIVDKYLLDGTVPKNDTVCS